MEAADGGLRLVDPVQAGAAEEGLVDIGGEEAAFLQLVLDRLSAVPELEGVEGGALRGIFRLVIRGFRVGGNPGPVVGMELVAGKGEDAVVAGALEGDARAIAGEELRLEAPRAVGAAPGADRGQGREGGEEENGEDLHRPWWSRKETAG